ncbi:MAG: prepilin-type N-terminal cleavage/methylation domain-containing protein [Candidatus Binatia bacterium]
MKAEKFQVRDPQSRKGFTLIELMVAMTLLALMMAILYGAFYLGHRAAEKTQARFEASQTLRSVKGFLRGYIGSAYPYRLSLRDPAVLFAGERERLTFVSALSMGLGGRGMSKISVSWDGEGSEASLVTLEEEIPVQGAGYRNTMVLWRGVTDLRLEYLDPRGEQEEWVGEWDGESRKTLPRAVRMKLRDDRGEEIRWVFPIMIRVLAP